MIDDRRDAATRPKPILRVFRHACALVFFFFFCARNEYVLYLELGFDQFLTQNHAPGEYRELQQNNRPIAMVEHDRKK